MEDLQTISAVGQPSFCMELMNRLNMQRKQDYLCDITLVTKDDKELKAHRNVLSAASPFFCKLLQSDMKENREGIVRFEEISGSVMEDVLEFIYTGTVELTEENAKELIAAGNYLLIPSLKTVSGRFLEQEMSNSNCISTFYFAEKYDCDELISDSRSFIHTNFASIAELDEFFSLDAKEVERWISSDEICVKAEADVFKIIVKWVEYNKSERKVAFEELFRHVRLSFLSRDCLQDVVTNELVRDSAGCLRLTLDAIAKMASFVNEDDLPQSPRKGLETRVIVACGGKYTFCYQPEEDQWKRLPDGLTEKNQKTQTMTFRDQLYTFKEFSKAERYDPVFNCWSALNLTESSADSATVIVVHGEIYAIEIDMSTTKSTVKRYNVERCAWQTVLSSHEGCRCDSCVVAAGSHLYVLGGTPPQALEYVTKAERFDTVEKKWEEIGDMQQARGGACGVAIEGKIFVAGGGNKERKLSTTCEIYNISTNEWQFIGKLNVCRIYGSMVCLKGTVYVLGGTRNYKERLLSVECYDLSEDRWTEKTTIPVEALAVGSKDTFTGCAVKLSKGVLDKSNVVVNLAFGTKVFGPSTGFVFSSSGGIFGNTTPSSSGTGGLFGGGLFGATSTTPSSFGTGGASGGGLFCATSTTPSSSGTGGLFRGGLFGATSTTPSSSGTGGASGGGLFGTTSTNPSSSGTGRLFGGACGLFGATSTTPSSFGTGGASGGGLFCATSTSTSSSGTGGLFGNRSSSGNP